MERDKHYYRQYRLQKLAGRKGLNAQAITDAAVIQRACDEFQEKYKFRPRVKLRRETMDEIGHLLKHEGDIKDLQHSQTDHANDQNAHGHEARLQAVENKTSRIPDVLLDVLASLPDEVINDLSNLLIDFADSSYDDGSNTSKSKQNSAAK